MFLHLLPVQWVQIINVMKLSSPARQTIVASLSGPAAMVPTTASTTVMRKAAVSSINNANKFTIKELFFAALFLYSTGN